MHSASSHSPTARSSGCSHSSVTTRSEIGWRKSMMQ
jgi:hypothetical protein